ncbi:MAG: ABC transporter substrate-binding protein, partial [Bacteroidota bacterium]
MKLKLALFSLLPSLLFFACGGPPADTDSLYPIRDGKVVYQGELPNVVRTHLSSNPSSLHPVNSELAARYEVLDLCYQRLMSVDIETGALVPELIIQMPSVSEDQLRYQFELHPKAAWNGGTPITAEDILFSTKLLVCPHVENQSIRPYLEYLSDIQVDPNDPRKFEVIMREFYLNNENFGIYTYVLDRRVYDPENILETYSIPELLEADGPASKDPDILAWAENFNDPKFGQEADLLNNGCGPYQMTEWTAEERIVLSRNESYWGKGLPNYLHSQYPDQIIFDII